MSYTLVSHSDCAQFLAVAEPFLDSGDIARTSLWGHALRSISDQGVRGWTLHGEWDNSVVGAFCWTEKSRALLLSDFPADAGPVLWEGLQDVVAKHADPRIRSWMGPETSTSLLESLWLQAKLDSVQEKMHTFLYSCSELKRRPQIDGHLRLATEADRDLCSEWATRFGIDTGIVSAGHTLPPIGGFLDQQRLFLWEVEGRPVASAVWGRPTPRTAHISFVFVPAELRGRHYAGAVTAGLTQHIFDTQRKSRATLFADAKNPITNHLYPSLGYEFVTGFREVGPMS